MGIGNVEFLSLKGAMESHLKPKTTSGAIGRGFLHSVESYQKGTEKLVKASNDESLEATAAAFKDAEIL